MDLNVKKSKKIHFFSILEKKEIISQSRLANKVLISLGMVNSLLKKAISKGYVKAKAAPYKRYVYYLTKQGFTEKSRLIREYLESSLVFFKQAKKNYSKILNDLKKKKNQIILVGDGDLCDICKLSALQENLEISGHLKLNNSKKLEYVFNKTTNKSENIAFVIVDSRNPQLIYDLLFKSIKSKNIYSPKFLHISKNYTVKK